MEAIETLSPSMALHVSRPLSVPGNGGPSPARPRSQAHDLPPTRMRLERTTISAEPVVEDRAPLILTKRHALLRQMTSMAREYDSTGESGPPS
ncbi:hypothetical protein BX265_0443 [Streptomyces sp. TLI_235]|nr:hypothetical protein BX265_0443 [Streptomyces sp. TLI_235]